MEPEQLLQGLGLSKNEVKTYLTLLKLGSVSAGPLIKELGMHRAAVYNLLDILVDKGLVHYVIQANRKYFEAQEPDRLLELINSQRKTLENQERQLKQIIPELIQQRKLEAENQEGTIYKGKKGLKSIFEDILKSKNQEFLVMGASGKFKELFGVYFKHWHDRRVATNISLRIIFSEDIRKEKREKELKLAKIRYIRQPMATPSTTFIYSDKIAIIMWSETPLAFLMKSNTVFESHKHFFNIFWNQAKD